MLIVCLFAASACKKNETSVTKELSQNEKLIIGKWKLITFNQKRYYNGKLVDSGSDAVVSYSAYYTYGSDGSYNYNESNGYYDVNGTYRLVDDKLIIEYKAGAKWTASIDTTFINQMNSSQLIYVGQNVSGQIGNITKMITTRTLFKLN